MSNGKSFDYQVDHYGKDGKVARKTPYRMLIDEGKKLMERPLNSGIWYAEDGTIARDDSAPIRAREAAEAQAKLEAEEKAKLEERAKLKAEIQAELEAEQRAKGKPHGSGSKN